MAESIAVKMMLETKDFTTGIKAATEGIKGVASASKPAAEGLKKTGRGAREAGEGLRKSKKDSQQAASGLKEVEKNALGAGNAMSGFKRKLAGIVSVAASAAGVKAILSLSDEMAVINARTNLMNDGLQSTAELQNKIFESAQRSRGEYQSTADAVAKMGILAKDAFSSNDETVAFLEQVNKQFAISGTSAEGRSAAMLQLTQAMGSGVLRGEELNSVLEQAPTIIQTIAKSLGVSTGELRNMAAEGKITSSVVKDALLSAAEETNAKFESMPMSFSNIMAKAKNIAVYGSRDVLQSINDVVNGKDGGDIEGSVNKMTTHFNDLFSGVESGIRRSGPAVSRLLKAAGGSVTQFMSSAVKSMSAGLKDFTKGGVEIVLAIGKGIASEMPSLIPSVVGGVMGAVEAVIDCAPDMFASGAALVDGIVKGIVNGTEILIQKSEDLIDNMFNTLNNTDALEKMMNSGISIVNSINSGIENLAYKMTDAGINLAQNLISGLYQLDWSKVGSDVVSYIAKNISLKNILMHLSPVYGIANGVKNAILDSTQDKTPGAQKSIYQNYREKKLQKKTLNIDAEFKPGLASGGKVTSSGSVMVGEKGPEILNLPRGASVTPLEKVSRTTNQFNMVFHVNAGDKSAKRVAAEIASELKLVLSNM